MPERVKKTKCGGGGVAKKIEGEGMPERVKKMKCGGGGCEINLKVVGGGMPERVPKTKCRGWGSVAEKIEGDAGEGKEDKMPGGVARKF